MDNRYKRWTAADIDMVISMRAKDLPIRDIAVVMGRTEPSIHCLLTRNRGMLIDAMIAANVTAAPQKPARPGFFARIFGWQ